MPGFEICTLAAAPGEIGLAPLPGRDGTLEDDLAKIRAWNPALVLSLTQPEEAGRRAAHLPGLLRASGFAVVVFPIPDFGIPDGSPEDWRKVAAPAHRTLDTGNRVLVHCLGGRGRSGMVAMRLLVERGEDCERALARLRRARPGAIETAAQEAWACRGP